MRSDAQINLDFLRGEVDPQIEEEIDEGGIEEEVDLEESEDFEDIGIAHYEEGENGDMTFEEMDSEYSGSVYQVEAQAGDGLTHVARRAYQAHHGDNPELNAEQEVFVEDYIQKNLDHSTGWLQLGETVEVPQELIDEAVEEAQQLNQDQLQNLSQYTSLS